MKTACRSGVGFHLAAVKGPVMDRLERAGFPDHFGRNCIHLSLDEAMTAVVVRLVIWMKFQIKHPPSLHEKPTLTLFRFRTVWPVNFRRWHDCAGKESGES